MIATVAPRPRATQQARREPVVADHQAEGQRADHDHAGGRAQSAQEREQRQPFVTLRERQRQRVHVRGHGPSQQGHAGARQRQARQCNQDQVQREQPARGAHVALVAALDHGDMELVRQDEHRQRAQQDERGEAAGWLRRQRCGRQVRPVVQAQPDERAQGEHCRQLEDGFERHRQHQAAVVLGRARPAGAEQHREQRHRQRHVQAAVAPERQ